MKYGGATEDESSVRGDAVIKTKHGNKHVAKTCQGAHSSG